MPAGELRAGDRGAVDAAIRRAEQLSRFEFSVFVGRSEGDPRAFATSLHNSLVAPPRSVLVMVDPQAKVLEVVTGAQVRQRLSDQEVELAVVSMRHDFAAGDLVGGLRRGVAMLAEHARPQRTLHAGA
ncbi:DUF5130 family protein [Nocardioides perillae]|uniref:DUF5130 family protein n=1 Tax=Nocardioides perillae TaxID=1119534 RepID=A0A7Y9RUG2_9ACTN|nr:hypothetical protein [Nocardioides perillae]